MWKHAPLFHSTLLLIRGSFLILLSKIIIQIAVCDAAYSCNGTLSIDADYVIEYNKASSRNVFYIESPQYPNNYPSDTKCNYVISVPHSFRVKISFLSFHVEEPFKDGSCIFDKLSISTSDASKDFCGEQNDNLNNLIFILDDPEILMRFESDDLQQFSGFKMQILFYSDSQMINLNFSLNSNVTQGQIISPNYALNYPLLPENIGLQISLSVDPSYCIMVTYTTLNKLLPQATTEQTAVEQVGNTSFKTDRQNVCYLSLNYSSLKDDTVTTVSHTICSHNNGESFNILDNYFKLFVNYQLIDDKLPEHQLSTSSNNQLPSFAIAYSIYRNESCESSQGKQFDLSQVGLWFLVSLSSLLAIGFFVSNGGLKHCRENRLCCYTHKPRVGSRRSSAVGGTLGNTPKSTRRPHAYITTDC